MNDEKKMKLVQEILQDFTDGHIDVDDYFEAVKALDIKNLMVSPEGKINTHATDELSGLNKWLTDEPEPEETAFTEEEDEDDGSIPF